MNISYAPVARGNLSSKSLTFLTDELAFLKVASLDLTQATWAFDQIEAHRNDGDAELLRFLMLAALIIYARPFTDSRGRDGGTHTLPPKQCVPKTLRARHDDLMTCRNDFFAHSDISAHKPHVSYMPDMRIGNNVTGFTKFLTHLKNTRKPDEFIPSIEGVVACINAARHYIRSHKQGVEEEIESRRTKRNGKVSFRN